MGLDTVLLQVTSSQELDVDLTLHICLHIPALMSRGSFQDLHNLRTYIRMIYVSKSTEEGHQVRFEGLDNSHISFLTPKEWHLVCKSFTSSAALTAVELNPNPNSPPEGYQAAVNETPTTSDSPSSTAAIWHFKLGYAGHIAVCHDANTLNCLTQHDVLKPDQICAISARSKLNMGPINRLQATCQGYS